MTSNQTKSHSIPLPMVESLHSWMMHELLSPASAIQNGIELHDELGSGGDDAGETWDLIGQSASKLSCLLQVFRVAFGEKKQRPESSSATLIKILKNLLAYHKVSLEIDDFSAIPSAMLTNPLASKTLCLTMLCLSKMFPRGGNIHFVTQDQSFNQSNTWAVMLRMDSEQCKPIDFWQNHVGNLDTLPSQAESPQQAMILYFLDHCRINKIELDWKDAVPALTLKIPIHAAP